MRHILLHIYIICIAALLADPCPASAQPRHHKQAIAADTVDVLVRQYTDSLQHSRRIIDSLQAIISANRTEHVAENKYYKLFVPMTFYHDIAHNRFSLDPGDDPNVLDDALLSVYFKRPDLVQSTQSKIDVVGPILNPQPAEVSPSTDMVEKVTPTPVDTDIDRIDIMVRRPNFWHFSGEFRLDLCQNYYSGNWYQGGESNYSTTQYVKFYAQYNDKQRFSMDHLLEAKLGFNSSKSDTVHSVKTNTSDLHYKGNFNLRAFKKWSYSVQVDARTQILRLFRANSNYVNSDFGSPLNMNVSVGMIYDFNWFKGKLNGRLNMGAFSYNYRYSDRMNLAYFAKPGHHSQQDYGSRVDLSFNIGFIKNLTWRVESYCYTSFERFESQILNKFDFRFNKYLATHLEFYSRFDDSRKRDDHHGYWMFRDYLTFGLSMNF